MPTVPELWIKGSLLDLRKFEDGSARATLLGEDYDPKAGNYMDFASLTEAQNFVSTWYLPATQYRG